MNQEQRSEAIRAKVAELVELLELGERPAVKQQAARTLDAYCRLMEEELALGSSLRSDRAA